MPKAGGDVTESAPEIGKIKSSSLNSAKRLLWLVLIVVLAGLTAGLVWAGRAQAPANTLALKLGNKTFKLKVARTDAERQKGLGGRDRLAANGGMLFVFGQPGIYCFWMKDMRFNLDIIWLDVGKKIIYVKQNLSPATYPQSYCSSVPGLYVVELNGGIASKYGLSPGRQLTF